MVGTKPTVSPSAFQVRTCCCKAARVRTTARDFSVLEFTFILSRIRLL